MQQVGGGRNLHKPRPYPRPGKQNDNTQKFGNSPIPVTDIRDWVKSYRKN